MKVKMRKIPEALGKPIFIAKNDYTMSILFENGYITDNEIYVFQIIPTEADKRV